MLMTRRRRQRRSRGRGRKSNARGGAGRNSGGSAAYSERGAAQLAVPFRYLSSVVYAASTALQTFQISDAFTTRLAAIAPNYQFYRFTRLEATIFPFVDTTSSNNNFVLCYQPAEAGVTDISTYSVAAEVNCRILHSVPKTVPSRLRIPQNVLRQNPIAMFATAAGSSYDLFQGNFHIVPRASSTTTISVEISGMIEFFAPTGALGSDKLSRIRQILTEREHKGWVPCSPPVETDSSADILVGVADLVKQKGEGISGI